jgi:catechol 2,3-dioxygenase-like lactoylglutathione lyase family enzyme
MKKKFKLHHVGYIVDNIEEAVDHFKAFYGVEDFSFYDFVPSRVWSYGKEVGGYHLKIAMSMAKDGEAGIELIQPISGEGVHTDFLKEGKGGMHHVCIAVDARDYEEYRRDFINQGYVFLFESETEDEVIGYRRCFYAKDSDVEMIMEVKENPYFRNKE